MSDAASILPQVVAAVNQLHDPTITPHQRLQAQEFCEKIKESSMCFQCGTYLAKTENTDLSRHFGLQLLEHMIRTKWYSFTNEEKDSLKRYSLELLAKGTKDMMTEKKFIKEKAVTLVVEMAKRDWPQQWEDMLNALVNIASIGETQAELVLMTFGSLPDEIKLYNDTSTTTSTSTLSEQRKKDLMTGINMGLQFLFNFFYGLLESNYVKYNENKVQNPDVAKRSLHFVSSVLQALMSYLEWTPLSLIMDSKFPMAFMQLLLESATRQVAAECLLLLLSRKASYYDKVKLQFPFENLEIFQKAMCITTNPEDDYIFHKRLGQTFAMMGTEVLKFITGKDKVPAKFDQYLQIMLMVANHPSLLMSSFALPFWKTCVENATVKQLPYFPALYSQLMQMCVNKLLKVGDPEKEKSEIAKYSKIDFETSAEYQKFQGLLRSRIRDFVKSLASFQPDLCLEFAGSRLQQMISTPIPPANAEQASVMFEAVSVFLAFVMMGLPNEILLLDDPKAEQQVEAVPFEDVAKQKSIQYIENILQLLFSFNPEHTLTIQCQLSCLQAFENYYAKHPQCIQYLLAKVIPLVIYRQGNEPVGQLMLSSETLEVRRKALSSLVHIAHHPSSPLLPFLPQLMGQAQQYDSQQLLLDKEKVLLTEALVIISNGMKNYQQQCIFLSNLLTFYETLWTSPEICAVIENPKVLLAYIGVLNYSSSDVPIYEERRRKLQLMINIFNVAYKRSAVPIDSTEIEEGGFGPFIAHGISFASRWPISQHNRTILPNIMALVRTVHALWDPAIRSLVPPDFAPIYQIDEAYAQLYMGAEIPKTVKSSGGDFLRYTRGFIEVARECSYAVVGHAAMHGDEFFTLNSIGHILLHSLFGQLEFIENRHLKILLKSFVELFVHHCPEKLHSSLLDQLLPSLFTAVFNHLNSSWVAYLARASNTSPGSEKTEILEDKILHDLTTEYLELLNTYVLNCTHIFSAPGIVFPMVYGIFGCLSWTDGVTSNRAAHMCLKLVPILIEDAQYHKLVGGEMLTAAIKALVGNRNPDGSQELLSLITDIYVHMRLISDVPKFVLLSLPNVNESIITQFNAQLRGTTDIKAQRNLFQRLLQDISGLNIQNLKHVATILDLPQKLFVEKVAGDKASSSSWIDSNPSLNLATLYDSHIN